MKKNIFALLSLMLLTSIPMMAQTLDKKSLLNDLNYQLRLGYSIGGTMPVPLPATIRKINTYTPQMNPQFGIDVQDSINGKWGVMVGVHFERKAMKNDAQVKSYHMELSKGGQALDGHFTGNVVTVGNQWMFTIPVQATYQVSKNVLLKAGPYISILTSKSFDGYVYDGYLRKGDPTGQRIEIGSEEDTRGNYEFNDHLRTFQWGVDVGADWYFSRHVGLSADISYGFSGIFDSSFKTIEQTLHPFFGTVGIILRK